MDEHPIKREFTRVRRATQAELSSGEETLRGQVRDISLKGLYVLCEPRWQAGTECQVAVKLGLDAEGELLVGARGKVVRVGSDGLGVEFTQLHGLESYWHLRNIVLYNAPDPEQAEQEFAAHVGLRRRGPVDQSAPE
jgi:hypothetical protein